MATPLKGGADLRVGENRFALSSVTKPGSNMDPDAAFSLLKDQIENAQWHEAAESAENLLEWLSKKGSRSSPNAAHG